MTVFEGRIFPNVIHKQLKIEPTPGENHYMEGKINLCQRNILNVLSIITTIAERLITRSSVLLSVQIKPVCESVKRRGRDQKPKEVMHPL